jgi:hypothetical protein
METLGLIRPYDNPITDRAFPIENTGKLVSRQGTPIAELAVQPDAAVGHA